MGKKVLSVFVMAGIILSILFIAPVYAMTASELSAKLSSLKSQYPNGTSQSAFYNASYYYSDGSGGPCYKDLSGYSSWECMAWGCKVYDTLWGSSIKYGSFHQNVNDIYVGDFVRYRSSGWDHAIIITNIDGNTLYYTDCNGYNSAQKIQWDRTISKADLQTKVNQALYKSQFGWSYGYIVHYPGNNIKNLTPYVDLGDDFYAKIVNTSSEKCLTNDLDNVSIRTDSNSENQWWHFTKNDDGTYKIASMYDQTKCLDVHLASTALKANIKVAADNGGKAQKWKITGSQGAYVLQALCTNNVLDIADGSMEDGSNVQTYISNETDAQLFTIETHTLGMYADIGSNFYANIYNYGLDTYVTNQASNVLSCSKTDLANQKWFFVRNSDYSYKIQSAYDGKCIDVDSYGTENGVNIKVEKDNGDTAQRWYIYQSGEGYYLRAKCTQKVMDVAGGVSVEGTNIQTYTANNSVAQLFHVNKLNLLDIAFDANGGVLNTSTKAETNADSINEVRGSDQLVIFNKGNTTGTNAYGYEVIVSFSNKVTETVYAVGDATIPAGGFVLSAHGTKSTWLDENINVGDYVSIDDENGKIYVYSAEAWIVMNKCVFTGDTFGDLPVPKRDGYIFKGWFADENGEKETTSDTVVTATEDITLYAQWDAAGSHASSVVTKSDTAHTVETELCNFAAPCDILVAGYKDNVFVTLERTPYGEDVSSCTLYGDIDEVKVMVWGSMSDLKPLCVAEVIPKSEWVMT